MTPWPDLTPPMHPRTATPETEQIYDAEDARRTVGARR